MHTHRGSGEGPCTPSKFRRRACPDNWQLNEDVLASDLIIQINMFTSARRRCLKVANSTEPTELSIPSFLLPAFQSSSRVAAFSTSSSCQSKIGGATLSLPPTVKFNIIDAPIQKPGARVSRTQQGATVEIEGPLGKMSLSIPAYMNIETDEVKRTHTLSILDQENRKQREMWGESREEPG